MRLVLAVAAVVTTLTNISLAAQQADETAPPPDDAKVTYAPASGSFGDVAESHAYEMGSVWGELEGKLDSKTAKVGDRVALKTTDKMQTSDGTLIPRGARLVGHVTEVQAYDEQHGPARIAIAFDRAELKNGQSLAVHTLILGVAPSANAMTTPETSADGGMGMPVPPGGAINAGRLGGPGYGSASPGYATSQVDRVSDAAVSENRRERTDAPSAGTTTGAGGAGSTTATGAHGIAAARAVPHPTNIPGVLLAGNSTSSGVLLGSRQNIRIDSGAQIELGVAADR